MEKRENDLMTVRGEYGGGSMPREDPASITRARLSGARRKKNKKLLVLLIYLAFIILMYLLRTQCAGGNSCGQDIPYVPQPVTGTDLAVHVIDVGQGDCALVQGGGVNILIDAGENGMGGRVVDYLLSHGVYRIELMILSHPHSDHIGGADTVINEPLISVGTVVMPDVPEELEPSTRTYEEVLDAVDRHGCALRFLSEDTRLEYGEMTLDIYTPFTYPRDEREEPADNLNACSLCARFECGGNSFLSCGDLTEDGEKHLLARHGTDRGGLKSRLFKASHHGSGRSNSRAFLEAVSPEYAYISVGKDNDFGHPSRKTLETLTDMKIRYERTDILGSFVYSFGADGMEFKKSA